jgi:hypothetical protein
MLRCKNGLNVHFPIDGGRIVHYTYPHRCTDAAGEPKMTRYIGANYNTAKTRAPRPLARLVRYLKSAATNPRAHAYNRRACRRSLRLLAA